MNDNLISILICTRNRAKVLERVLQLHPSLNVPKGWMREYIIVDNGSTDDTQSVVERFRNNVSFDVHYVFEPKPGHSIALNAGCKAARGEIIAFTDDDAIPVEHWLEEIIRSIVQLGNDWAYGPVEPLWEYGKKPFWYGPKTSMWVACLSYGEEPFIASDPKTPFAGVNHACRTKRLFELGLYDEEKGLRGDGKTYTGNDDDLYMKALAQQYRVHYNPAIKVQHIIDAKRYGGMHYMRISWLVGRNEAFNYQESATPRPSKYSVLIPAYRYRFFAKDLWGFLVACLTLSPSNGIFYLTKVNRFLGFFMTSLAMKLGKKSH